MIKVISRFRAANGHESSVRDAFLLRPHLVDHVTGFLGMEVFTDENDPALFYLVTRWTDVESFRRWHGSEAHHLSHQGIPRGLKLDPAHTQILTLRRLDDRESSFDQIAVDHAPLLASLLESSRNLYLLSARTDGTIRRCNPALAALLGVPAEDLAGRSAWSLCAAADAISLQERVARGPRDSTECFLLNLVDSRNVPRTLELHLDVQPDGFVLAGTESRSADTGFQAGMVELNNELAISLRENARQRRELEQAYWHIKKFQEVLPMCMGCGLVKHESQGWQEAVQYLKEHAPFLSHGYCPDCAVQMRAEWSREEP